MKWVNFAHVRQSLDVRAVLSHYEFDAQQTGADQVKILCPFHEDETPSCGFNLTKKIFHCFSCQTKGNILGFVARMEGFDPTDTKQMRAGALAACRIFGIDPAPPGEALQATEGQKRPDTASKASVGRSASAGDKSPLSKAPVASGGRVNVPLSFQLSLDQTHPYLAGRNVPASVIAEFGIGYCSLGSMKGRICFPIHNETGELIGYSGRWVDGQPPPGVPRYLLPKGFEKSRVLFNLNRVLSNCPDTVVIVEGFWSVLRLHAAGLPVVSTFGDSISDAQVDLLVQAGLQKTILIYDGDQPGRLATQTALPVLASHLFVKSFDLPDGIKPDTMDERFVTALRHGLR
jgi:DNA primase